MFRDNGGIDKDDEHRPSKMCSSEALAEWDFHSKSGKPENLAGLGEQRFIRVPKRNLFFMNLNEKHNLEHKGWFCYSFW